MKPNDQLISWTDGDVNRLLRDLLRNRTTDYKGRFIHALVGVLETGSSDLVALRDLATEILARAHVTKVPPTPGSVLEHLLDKLETAPFEQTALCSAIDARITHKELDQLLGYVPFRAITGFFTSELRNIPDRLKNGLIERLAGDSFDTDRPALYRFVDHNGRRCLHIHPFWRARLLDHRRAVLDAAVSAVVADSHRLSMAGGHVRAMRRDRLGLTAVRTEGAILPAGLLQRIHREDTSLGGLKPDDYGLSGERIREAASRAWNALQSPWRTFQADRAALKAGEAATGMTRKAWLSQILKALDYGVIDPAVSSLRVGERDYPISHFYCHAPLHLVGSGLDLDRKTPGAVGAAQMSPHGLVQLYLNACAESLWGFVSNGLRWRILRDSVSLSRQAMVEFDLELIFEGQIYDEFLLFYLLCHQSRMKSGKPEECWLEKWSQSAGEEGKRALDTLRGGVEKAIETLGQGYLRYPANETLRGRIRAGGLDKQDYYRQLLRMVYRLLFLFVAEDRNLLLHPDATPEARRLYTDYYGTRRLRLLAERLRGAARHHDLFTQLRIVLGKLGEPDGCPELGLPALGGFLFSDDACPDLDAADLSNGDLLEAVRCLAVTQEGGRRVRVDYKNLDVLEMGSVYESLLELHPDLSSDGTHFALQTSGGNERKTSGSYYTHDSLVQCLLDTALEPVVDARLDEAKRLANSEIAIRGRRAYADQLISRSHPLAASDESSGGLLPGHQGVSERRTLWDDQPDSPGIGVDSGEHSRGMGAGGNQGVHPVPADRPGQPQGVGDSSYPRHASRADRTGEPGSASPADGRGRQDDSFPDWFFTAQAAVGPTSLPPYSLLAEHSILALNVIDPAVGSGHFLIAAAHRLARRLAQERSGDEEPSPEATRRALRDVIGHCLYGVDLNPMAAELCKVALWMESLEPGRPLSFLDHHIQVGNSLIGATPELIAKGIPDEAYTAIEGDDKAVCASLKKQNRDEKIGQGSLFSIEAFAGKNLVEAWQEVETGPDHDLSQVRRKATAYDRARKMVGFRKAMADAWCAAFLLPKTQGAPAVTANSLRLLTVGQKLDEGTTAAIERTAERFCIFHPFLAFPDVFAAGGFDVVLGNPPWERVKLQEKEFFAERMPTVATAKNKAERDRLLRELRGTGLHMEFLQAKRDTEATSSFLRKSDRYPLAGRGDVNTYAVFTELNRSLVSPTGRAGIIVPSGIATDDTTKAFFWELVSTNNLASIFMFDYRSKVFPDVSKHYALVTIGRGGISGGSITAAAELMNIADLADTDRRYILTSDDIALLNPNTKTCPVFRTQRDAEITKAIYRRVPVLIREGDPNGNPWGISFQRMFDMSNDSHLFRTREELDAAEGSLDGNRWSVARATEVNGREIARGLWPPLYEAKMIHHFDHRWATYDVVTEARGKRAVGDVEPRDVTLAEKMDPNFVVMPRYWVHEDDVDRAANSDAEWFIGFRDITNSTNARTAIFAVIPRSGVGHKMPLVHFRCDYAAQLCFLAMATSFCFDFVARQKIGGTSLTYHYVRQFPTVPPSRLRQSAPWCNTENSTGWLACRVIELIASSNSTVSVVRDAGYGGELSVFDEDRRFLLRAELDAAFFHLYGIDRADVDYIMESFPIVKRGDIAAHGRYRTKEVILEIYDEMAEAMRTGVPYQTRLDPPPANGWVPPELASGELRVASGDSGSHVSGEAGMVRAASPPLATTSPIAPPEDLVMAAPGPQPLKDKDGEIYRVRVYNADDEVVLKRGVLLERRKREDGTTWVILPDGETTPRQFLSPPLVVKRLRAKP